MDAIGAAILGGTSLLGGLFGSKSSEKAADKASQASIQAAQIEAQAARDALAFQRRVYEDQLRLQQPYYGTGTNALAQLGSLYGLYQAPNFAGGGPAAMASQPAQPAVATQQPTVAGGGQQATRYLPGVGNVAPAYADLFAKYNDPALGGFDKWSMDGISPQDRYALTQNYAQGEADSWQDIIRGISGSGGAPAQVAQPQQSQAPMFNPTGMGGFYGGPEYELAQNSLGVAMDRGMGALDRSAAASGGFLSGAQAKAISDYAQDTNQRYVQGAYDQYANRLAALAGIGQTASNAQGNAASQYGANAGNLMQAAGQAQGAGVLNAGQYQAGGITGASNAWGNALNNIMMLGGSGAFNGLFGGNTLAPTLPTMSGGGMQFSLSGL